NYTSQAGKLVRVNGAEDALEFVDAASVGTNYWSKLAGVLSPTLAEPLAASSAATTVGTFTSTGSNLAFQAGGASSFTTIDQNGNITTAGDLSVNGDNIDADGSLTVTGATGLTLASTANNVTINSAGTIELQDNTNVAGTLTANSLLVRDTNQSHTLSFVWNENEASANRTLNLLLNGGNRSLSLSGDLTVESASIINQDVTTDASVTFAGLTLTGLSADTDTRV